MNLQVSIDPIPEKNDNDEKPCNHPMKERLNGATGYLKCRFLEWSGWYSYDVRQRLLGHYRLFQIFKGDKTAEYRHFTVYQSYILQYRGSHEMKYFTTKIMYFIFTTVCRQAYAPVEIEALNRILLNEESDILHQFLIDAEVDLGQAIEVAANKINTPGFFHRTAKETIPSVQVNAEFTQINQEVHNHYEINNHAGNSYSFYEHHESNHYSYAKVVNMSVVSKEGEATRGKEKGVFSKKQLLILFDLISDEAKIEAIDLAKPNKFDGIAELLHALTGKSKETWMEELKDYQNKSLYEAYTLGELRELINSITTISTVFRAAGFRSVAKIADKKISELEKRKKTWDQ